MNQTPISRRLALKVGLAAGSAMLEFLTFPKFLEASQKEKNKSIIYHPFGAKDEKSNADFIDILYASDEYYVTAHNFDQVLIEKKEFKINNDKTEDILKGDEFEVHYSKKRGTGTHLGNGIIYTAQHVVKGYGPNDDIRVIVPVFGVGYIVKARKLAEDITHDTAVIQAIPDHRNKDKFAFYKKDKPTVSFARNPLNLRDILVLYSPHYEIHSAALYDAILKQGIPPTISAQYPEIANDIERKVRHSEDLYTLLRGIVVSEPRDFDTQTGQVIEGLIQTTLIGAEGNSGGGVGKRENGKIRLAGAISAGDLYFHGTNNDGEKIRGGILAVSQVEHLITMLNHLREPYR